MGRNKKKQRGTGGGSQGQVEPPQVMSPHNKRDILELVKYLLDKSSSPMRSGPQEWDDFLKIYGLVEMLRERQTSLVMKPYKREDHFEDFMIWLGENHVDTSLVTIAHFEKEGHGLKVTQDVNMSDSFLSIPRKLMMSTETAKTSQIGFLIDADRILQGMPNVVLALHLLAERATPNSFWSPYIKTLPMSYTTPLYFKQEDIQLLKGSPVFSDVLNHWRNIARQYTYFHTLFQTNPEAGKLPMKDFTFDDYRWAVSTVMTRQNQIPSATSAKSVNALIPLWDMCNHCNGEITTDFNVKTDSSECFALRNFPKDSQVFIYYGSRSNAELFLHSGFVYPNNQCDKIAFKLGVSKKDELFEEKTKLLARLATLPSRIFYLHLREDPVDSDLLAFLRVLIMSKSDITEHLSGDRAIRLQRSLRDFGENVSKDNELRAWRYLETRINLLLGSYSTTAEEDGLKLEKFDLSEKTRMAVQLTRCEKRILGNVANFAHKYIMRIESWPDTEHQQLPMLTAADTNTNAISDDTGSSTIGDLELESD